MVFAVSYPLTNAQEPGRGSDDDDAYNIGAHALLTGQSPYASRTYLDNPLHQFAGAFVAAAPFALLGTSALQNLFWLPALFLVLRRERQDDEEALKLGWLLLVACPAVVHQLVTGTGHFANATYVLVGLWWLARSRQVVLPAVAFAVAVASRANFLFLVPLAIGYVARRKGSGAALRSAVAVIITVALLILPFYWLDPTHFGPLEAADRLRRVNQWIPFGGESVALLMTLVAVAGACTRLDLVALFGYCSLVQAVPILVVSLVELLTSGTVDLEYAIYSLFALPFVLATTHLFAARGSLGHRARETTSIPVSKAPQAITS